MKTTRIFAATLIAALGLMLATASAAEPKEAKPAAAAAEPKLPPGWTAEDMQAFIQAATPGKMHERLVQEAGVWKGKNTMWMGPDSEPTQTDAAITVKPILGGRFVQVDMAGEMPGMGPYHGLAVQGYDNMTQKFTSTWVDNVSTAAAQGEGELSSDGKTLTWTFTCNCPIQKKSVTMRQVETTTGKGTKTIEMFGAEPKSGKEYKMMRMELTKAK